MIDLSPSANAVRPSYQDAAAPQLRRVADQAQATANALQMQARDAWQKVDNATSTARAIDGQANQAVSSAGKAKQALSSFTSAVLSASKTAGVGASASVAPPPRTYNASASAVVSVPVTGPATLNNIGQPIGARFSIEA